MRCIVCQSISLMNSQLRKLEVPPPARTIAPSRHRPTRRPRRCSRANWPSLWLYHRTSNAGSDLPPTQITFTVSVTSFTQKYTYRTHATLKNIIKFYNALSTRCQLNSYDKDLVSKANEKHMDSTLEPSNVVF